MRTEPQRISSSLLGQSRLPGERERLIFCNWVLFLVVYLFCVDVWEMCFTFIDDERDLSGIEFFFFWVDVRNGFHGLDH